MMRSKSGVRTEPVLHIAQWRTHDVANGPGVRVSVFVSGCTHACPECFNIAYQQFSYGEVWTKTHTQSILSALQDPLVQGLTLLGGEPFQNLALVPILAQWRCDCPEKDVWVYSGYTWEEIVADPAKNALLSLCDVLVDGRFIAKQKDLRLRFRGSANQRILDVKKSQRAGAPVLWEAADPEI